MTTKIFHPPKVIATETVDRDDQKYGAMLLNEDTGHDGTLGIANAMCSTDLIFSGIAGGGHKAATSQR